MDQSFNRRIVLADDGSCLALLRSLTPIETREPFRRYGSYLILDHFPLLFPAEPAVLIGRILQSLGVAYPLLFHRRRALSGNVSQCH